MQMGCEGAWVVEVLGSVPADLTLLRFVLLRMLSTRDMVVIVVVVLALDLLSCGRKALAAEMRGREAELVSSCDTFWLPAPIAVPADVLGSNEEVAGLLASEEVPELNRERPTAFPSFSGSFPTLKRTDLTVRTVLEPSSLLNAFCPVVLPSAAVPPLLRKESEAASLQWAAEPVMQLQLAACCPKLHPAEPAPPSYQRQCHRKAHYQSKRHLARTFAQYWSRHQNC
jgi:hypothetical protein